MPIRYASQWFLTLFTNSLELPLAFRVLDLFFHDGFLAIFQVSLALLQLNHDFLMRQGFEYVLAHLARSGIRDLYKTAGEHDTLINAALNIKLTCKQLQRLERDYAAKKAREVQEAGEILRLKVENDRLAQENASLKDKIKHQELEMSTLAAKMLHVSIELNRRGEEIDDLHIFIRALGHDPCNIEEELTALLHRKAIAEESDLAAPKKSILAAGRTESEPVKPPRPPPPAPPPRALSPLSRMVRGQADRK